MAKGSVRVIASNKKARHDYFIEDTYEAGIVLHGTEVKSLRQGHCSIKESFVRIDNGEVIIYGMHMLHKYEINKLVVKLNEKGLTLLPLQVYFKGSLVKVEIGLARGKKLYDKRQDIAKRDMKRENEREFKHILKG